MSELLFLVLAFAVFALPVLVIVAISSAIRKTPMGNGFKALGWSFVIFSAAVIAGSVISPQNSTGVTYLAGGALAFFFARRGGYSLDWQGWVLLLLSAPGYWLLMWRRENALWRRGLVTAGQQAVAPPSLERNSAGGLAQDLMKLDELRQRGILTDEEFAAKKKQILGS
jgi:hypothetical protein